MLSCERWRETKMSVTLVSQCAFINTSSAAPHTRSSIACEEPARFWVRSEYRASSRAYVCGRKDRLFYFKSHSRRLASWISSSKAESPGTRQTHALLMGRGGQ